MNPNFNIASLGRLLGALSLACAAALPAHAAIPATPLVTEIFVNKNGVLGLAWNPIANAASVRVQVQTSGTAAYCKLDATKPTGCLVNQVVALNGPLAPALNTGISVAAYNSGNVFVRLVAVDSTGKNWRNTAWIAAPRYRGMTSGGKTWPLASVEPGRSVTVSATMTNTTALMDLWAFDINGNLPAKSRSGVNFTVTPMPVGNQAWVLKSKSGGLVVDQGSVLVNELAALKFTVPAYSWDKAINACQPQCVTFIKQNSGLTASVGNAVAYASAPLPGFGVLQRNGAGAIKPKPGDILVFSGPSAYGHVALVESVNLAAGTITRVATNENLKCGFSRVTGKLQRSATGAYTITWTDSASSWRFAGWRPKG
jgi:surface antigen